MKAFLGVVLCNCSDFASGTHCSGKTGQNDDGFPPQNVGCATQILRVFLTSCSGVQLSKGHERSIGEERCLDAALWGNKRITEQTVKLVNMFLRIASR